MPRKEKMVHVNYHMTTTQIESLKCLSGKTGLSVAELIRRAVDAWLESKLERTRNQQ